MSGIDEATVKKLAALARLALDDAEVRALVPELQGIVAYVDAMRALDTTGVSPMIHGHPAGAMLAATAAADSDREVLGECAIAQSAVQGDDGSVVVPKVIE